MSEVTSSNSYFAKLGELLAGAGVSPDRVETLVLAQIKDELQELHAGLSQEVCVRLDAQILEAKAQVEREVQQARAMLEELQLEAEAARQTAEKCASAMRLVIWLMLGHGLMVGLAIAAAYSYLR